MVYIRSMNIQQYILSLSQHGRHFFTLDEALDSLHASRSSLLAALLRLQNKHVIAKPSQGFYLILPPRYQSYRCLPADQFIHDLMNHLNLPYYIGLLSAASYLGASHQKPQSLQVITNKYCRPLQCGDVSMTFIENTHCNKVPSQQFNTPTGYITVSTPEATAIDLLRYPLRSGGINNIATVLTELSEVIDPKKLKITVEEMQPDNVTMARLGYLFEFLEEKELANATEKEINFTNFRPRPLVKGTSTAGSNLNKRWRLYINYKVEPDL